jgi:hypothetical protein
MPIDTGCCCLLLPSLTAAAVAYLRGLDKPANDGAYNIIAVSVDCDGAVEGALHAAEVHARLQHHTLLLRQPRAKHKL